MEQKVAILEERIRHMADDLSDIKDTHASVARSLEKLVELNTSVAVLTHKVDVLTEAMKFHRNTLWGIVTAILLSVFGLVFNAVTLPVFHEGKAEVQKSHEPAARTWKQLPRRATV